MNPRVSIIMPVLNGEKYIGKAIASIRAQTFQDYELIVVDDGSTDSTPALLRGFSAEMRLKIVTHSERRGIARSVNDGLREVEGEFVAFLDHDDEWFPDFLDAQLRYLDQHPDVGMAHSDFQTIDGEGAIIEASVATCRNRTRPSGNVFRALFLDSFIVGNSVMIRKECFDRIGGFDEVLRWGDYHMWLRIARNYKIDYQPLVLTKYRQHGTQSTRDLPKEDPTGSSVGLSAIQSILKLYPDAEQELGRKTIRRRVAALYFDMAYTWYTQGAFRHARLCAGAGLRLWPTNWGYLMMYVTCLPGGAGAKALQNINRRLRGGFAALPPTQPVR